MILASERAELAAWSCEPFLRWAALRGARVHDPHGAYPDVAAAAASQGVELFWPPPRTAALRYFAGFLVTLLAVCAIPVGFLLVGEARKAPGLVDFVDHLVWMARPVAEVTGVLLLGSVFLTSLQVLFVRQKILRAARRFSLPEGERLLALCYARTRHVWPPPPAPEPDEEGEEAAPEEGEEPASEEPASEAPAGSAAAREGLEQPAAVSPEDDASPQPADDAAREPEESPAPDPTHFPRGPLAAGAPWGEFLAVTDQRFLQLLFGEGRNLVLEVCRREEIVAMAHLEPAQHPLLGLLRHLRSDGRGARLWTTDGRELQITSEVLFHQPLLDWLEQAGHALQDWGYLPLELEGWTRSELDPRRAEKEPDPPDEARPSADPSATLSP